MKWITRILLLFVVAGAVTAGFRLGRALPGGRGSAPRTGRRITDWLRTTVPAARVFGELGTIRSQNDRMLTQNEKIYVQNERILSLLQARTPQHA